MAKPVSKSARTLWQRVWYGFIHKSNRLACIVFFQLRCSGRRNVPATGGGIVLSNHQSHLDSVLIGISSDRRMNFLARETLFDFAPLRWLIKSLDAIPIDRDGSGLAGLKEMLKRLKRQELVLIFPEGTRSPDGKIARFRPGVCAVARRAGVPLIPAAIAGAFEAWPKHHLLPRVYPVRTTFGEPLWPADFANLSDDELIAEVERRVRACHADLVRAADGGERETASRLSSNSPAIPLSALQ